MSDHWGCIWDRSLNYDQANTNTQQLAWETKRIKKQCKQNEKCLLNWLRNVIKLLTEMNERKQTTKQKKYKNMHHSLHHHTQWDAKPTDKLVSVLVFTLLFLQTCSLKKIKRWVMTRWKKIYQGFSSDIDSISASFSSMLCCDRVLLSAQTAAWPYPRHNTYSFWTAASSPTKLK